MAALQTGLGRGLGALFQDEPPAGEKSQNQTLPIATLVPNPKQPRKDFEKEALQGLADSIASQGLLQPILVREVAGSRPPRYEIVAGERRWRASQIAGLAEVPVIIRELSDQDTLAIALIENLQREDLNPLEEAQGIRELKEEFGMSQEALAKTLGKSRSAIANILRLLNLSAKAQEALQKGQISAGHARAILALAKPEEQEALLDKIVSAGLTVREAEGWAASNKDLGGEGDEASAATEDSPLQPKPGLSGSRGKKLPQSAVLLDLQNRLCECVQLPVRLTGGEHKGKLSISYSSREELAALLGKIGLDAEI